MVRKVEILAFLKIRWRGAEFRIGAFSGGGGTHRYASMECAITHGN